ncbi:hypothetical protein TeGR_g8743 [Tetraparma gracilis]|uniref:BART domain-containing protein n=1 Tax=Tetraparma gracilis TaxID=2962635 RepID=A0ABQ6NCE2_9STRA|nr:hypothetical protein TeGR_g8743 [Tetraparma gracilis]
MSESKEADARDECKDGPATDESEDRQLSALVSDFAEYCSTAVFGEELQEFEREHAHLFREANVNEEQDLRWTAIWEDYVAIVERNMEDFCKKNGSTSEELFKQISDLDSTDSHIVNDFLPQVLLNVEYSNFVKQMREVADEHLHAEAAEEATLIELPPGDKVNISGTFCAHSRYKYAVDNFDKYLQAIGAPWVLRKLIIKTTQNIQDVFIVQDEDQMSFKFKMKMFGSRSAVHKFNGEPVFKKNLWGIETFQVASLSAEGVQVRVQNHPKLGKDGHIEHRFFLDDDDDLNWVWFLSDPDRDLELKHVLKFERQLAGRK